MRTHSSSKNSGAGSTDRSRQRCDRRDVSRGDRRAARGGVIASGGNCAAASLFARMGESDAAKRRPQSLVQQGFGGATVKWRAFPAREMRQESMAAGRRPHSSASRNATLSNELLPPRRGRRRAGPPGPLTPCNAASSNAGPASSRGGSGKGLWGQSNLSTKEKHELRRSSLGALRARRPCLAGPPYFFVTSGQPWCWMRGE